MIKLSTENPEVRCYQDGRRVVLAPIEVEYDDMRWTVRAGTIVDGSSIPRFFWRILGAPDTGPNLLAGLIHDDLYTFGLFERAAADLIFYKILLKLKKPRWQAWLMYRAVRLFGHSHYKK